MILYFSGTGNSRFVAYELGKQLKDEVVAINTYLKEKKKGVFESSNSYVFVTPSYMSRMPMKVEKFLLEAMFKGNKMDILYLQQVKQLEMQVNIAKKYALNMIYNIKEFKQ